ncbi:GH32 C-terminal domain-containing protein [Streptosporangium sp. LJ11]|uniref:GH32 C-terminal domain-containing protein n=1 Tax=Streptosporangium sp. LJ11 TaxID=3436927 RepID=UPI003F7A3D2E
MRPPHTRARSRAAAVLAALVTVLGLAVAVPTSTAGASAAEVTNPDFETGGLSGWTATGNAFAASTDSGWGWGCCFGQHGTSHVWGFKAGGDAATGTLTSSTFTLSGTGQVDFLVGGGNNADTLYVALVKASDGSVLRKATGADSETYRRVTWDASAYLGQDLQIRVVDQATAGWGHINLDDVHTHTPASPPPAGLTNPDFETGDLSGWTKTGSAFAVSADSGWGWGCCFGQHGTFHLWGFKTGGDAATGTLTSGAFRLSGSGKVDFLVGGGNNADTLYVALVKASDGSVLRKATGADSETYRRVTWDASAYLGQDLQIRVVDQATAGWGHINLDDIRLDGAPGDGVVAHWPFDETAGSTVKDTVSGRSDPVNYVFTNAKYKPNSDPLWYQQEPAGKKLSHALMFDGYSTWVTRPGFAAPTDAITVEAWVAPRAFEWGDEGKLEAIVNQQDQAAGRGFILGIGRHGTWAFQASVGGSWQSVWADADASLPARRWSHVAATFNAADHSMKLYLNGRQVGSRTVPAGTITPDGGDLVIGKNNRAAVINGLFPVNTVAGLIDEVKIYDKALIGTEVTAAYDAVRTSYGDGKVPTPDLSMNRARYTGDKYRPQYHFSAPEHWMNEPHAPIFHNGQYHLFYQQNQHGPFWHNIGWGHQVSPDMVNWRDLPPALVPTAGSVAPDGVWSGSATKDANGNPLLYITAGDDSVYPNQRTGIARCAALPCQQDLRDWKMDPAPVTVQSPALDVGAGRKVKMGEFRDPFVWREGGTWFQLVASGVQTTGGADVGGTALLYSSTDQTTWKYEGPLMVGDIGAHPKTGQVWELPVFLPLGDSGKYVFMINPQWSGGSPHNVKYVWYWIGSWNAATRKFTPDSTVPKLFDYGEHFTGPSGFVDEQGRSVVFSIAQDKRTEQGHHDSGWAHNAGLPMRVTLRPDGDLGVAPLPEMASLHTTTAPLASLTNVTDLAAANQQLGGVKGDMLHLQLTMSATTATKYGIKVRRSPNGEEETLLSYDRGAKTFCVDRTRAGSVSSLSPDLGVQCGPATLDGDVLTLDVFLDKSMIEAYAGGKKSITTRVYPGRDDSLGLALWADGGATVQSLKVWAMKPAY